MIKRKKRSLGKRFGKDEKCKGRRRKFEERGGKKGKEKKDMERKDE